MALLVALLAGMVAGAWGREWVDGTGRVLEGEMLGVERGGAVVVAGGKRVWLGVGKLSAVDQIWVKRWCEGKSVGEQLPPPVWVGTVPQAEVHVSGGGEVGGAWVFKSAHYVFRCDAEVSASVMNDFATVAEGTLKLVGSLPVAMPGLEGRTLTAQVVQSAEAYERGGGPAGSAGVFTYDETGDGVLLVPFSSLGIEKFGGKNTKSYGYSAKVLVHEMTHQAMGEWLAWMPKWVAEGMAEYAAQTTYRNGVFYTSAKDRVVAMKQRLEYVRAALGGEGKALVMRPSEVMAAPESAWTTEGKSGEESLAVHRMYVSSMLLMHYYLHLADKGEARRIRWYFQELEAANRYFRSGGKEGSLPEGLGERGRVGREEVRAHFLKLLEDPAGPGALDADFKARYAALGVRL